MSAFTLMDFAEYLSNSLNEELLLILYCVILPFTINKATITSFIAEFLQRFCPITFIESRVMSVHPRG